MNLNIAIHAGTRASSSRAAVVQATAVSQDQESVLVAGLSGLLMFAVLTFGSTDQWAITILEIGSALLLLFWIWPQMSSRQLQLRARHLFAPVVLFGLIIVVQVVFRLSAYVYVTRQEAWKYAAYGSLFLLANQCRRAGKHRLLMTLAGFGFIVAVFALVQHLTGNDKIYWFRPAQFRPFGPYFNPNHYAGLMEMLTPIPFAMALMDRTRRYQQFFWTIAGIVMAATIFVCGSRGGIIAFAVQMVFLATFFVARKSRQMAWAIFAMCLAIVFFALWIDNGTLVKRLDSLRDPLTNVEITSRLTIARDSLQMVRDRPLIGWGLGLFPLVYPQYRSFSTDLVINQAHNDYVQALVETGILGFTCVLWFIVNLYHSGIRDLRTHSRVATATALGPLVGCTGILVHSLSDFNLHIPANAALFFVLCGIATGVNRTPRSSEERI